jgi:putative ABC transport system ATP-binding protein
MREIHRTIVQLKGVSKRYGEGENEVQALADADLEVRAGEVLLIEGPSGSGKTTLLSILGLLLRPSHGDLVVKGQRVTGLPEKALPAIRASTFGFIFQSFNLFPALTAAENVALALQVKAPGTRNALRQAEGLLERVGLGERKDHLPSELSGGQKQRVAVARALAGDPAVILGDEPTAALDTKTGLAIVQLLRDLATTHRRAVVIVTHDHRLEGYADRIVRVEDGRVREDVSHARARAAVG